MQYIFFLSNLTRTNGPQREGRPRLTNRTDKCRNNHSLRKFVDDIDGARFPTLILAHLVYLAI